MYSDYFQFLLIYLSQVSTVLHKGDRAIIHVPILTQLEDQTLLKRLYTVNLKVQHPYKITDSSRIFEKI